MIKQFKPTKAQLKLLELLDKNPKILCIKSGRRLGNEITYYNKQLLEFMDKLKIKVKSGPTSD